MIKVVKKFKPSDLQKDFMESMQTRIRIKREDLLVDIGFISGEKGNSILVDTCVNAEKNLWETIVVPRKGSKISILQ